jgi:hypothetical protein
MLYNFAIMLKSLAVIAVVALLSGDASKKDQRADLAKSDSGNGGANSTLTVVNNHAAAPKEDSANSQPPHWYARPEWYLLILGIPTLIFVGIQAVASREAAEAALKQANYLEASERAWLVMRSSMGSYTPGQDGDKWMYWWEIENTGHTPARIIETQCVYEIVEWHNLLIFPAVPKYPEPIEVKGFLLPPGGKSDYNTFLRQQTDGRIVKPHEMESGVIHMIEMEGMFLRAYGYVKYLDAFGKARESRFCDYYVWPLKNKPHRVTGFRPFIGAPAEYTECT